MRFPSKETVERVRKEYPVGSRVELVRMDDPQAPPVGTKGTVRGVDDIGSIMVAWDNGCGLSVAYGATAYDLLRLRHKRIDSVPDVVLYPETTEQVEQIVAYSTEHHIPLYVYGGGSSVTRGVEPVKGGISLDMRRNFNKVIIPEISRRDFQGILLIVSNPVDILTYTALKLSGFPENRVIGSGTVLDTARLKYALSEHLGVDSRSVHSFIIGEHGDSEIAAWSSTNVSGIPLNTFCEMRGHYNHDAAMDRIAEEVKNSAYDIISKNASQGDDCPAKHSHFIK